MGPFTNRHLLLFCGWQTYLLLLKHGSKAVEELEWIQDLTLDQYAGYDGCGGPPTSADGHLEEPLLQGHPIAAA